MHGKGFKFTCTSIIVIVLVAVSTSHSSEVLSNIAAVVYAYSNTQVQSLDNDCGIGDTDNTNCANNGPLIQGDGSASSPVVSQSAGREQGYRGPPGPQGPSGPQGEQGPPGPKGDSEVSPFGNLRVISRVIYPIGYQPIYDSADFAETVSGQYYDADPSNFVGSDIGTNVKVGIGEYMVTENTPDPQFDVFYSSDCSGTMRQGETKECTITNLFRNLVIIKEFENHSPGDTGTSPSSFTIQVEGNNPDPASFPGSDKGTRTTLGVGEYRVTELDPGPRIETTFSADCNGVIQPDDQKTCKILNVLTP